jgi:hypothetical protein
MFVHFYSFQKVQSKIPLYALSGGSNQWEMQNGEREARREKSGVFFNHPGFAMGDAG